MRRNRNGFLDAAVGNLEALVQRALGASGDAAGAAFAVTPNAEPTLVNAYAPTTAGAVLFAVDITPAASALLSLSFNGVLSTSAADTPTLEFFYVDLLTSVTGGTEVQSAASTGKITALPTTLSPIVTVPAANSGTLLYETTQPSGTLFNVSFAQIPATAVPGHRTLLACFGVSNSNTTTWSLEGTIAVFEKP